jgi:hypothetical protein
MTSHCGALIGLNSHLLTPHSPATFTRQPLTAYTEISKSTLRLLTVSAAARTFVFSAKTHIVLPSLLLRSSTATRGLPYATHAVLHVVGVQNAKFLQNAVLTFRASNSRQQRLSLCRSTTLTTCSFCATEIDTVFADGSAAT